MPCKNNVFARQAPAFVGRSSQNRKQSLCSLVYDFGLFQMENNTLHYLLKWQKVNLGA